MFRTLILAALVAITFTGTAQARCQLGTAAVPADSATTFVAEFGKVSTTARCGGGSVTFTLAAPRAVNAEWLVEEAPIALPQYFLSPRNGGNPVLRRNAPASLQAAWAAATAIQQRLVAMN